MGRLAILLLLAGCELRGLTRSQLYGSQADASLPADTGLETPDAAVEVAVGPDAGALETPDAVEGGAGSDAGAVDLLSDAPLAPPDGIIVTGFVAGICNGESVMVGGAGFHTCSYAGKGSYRLRIRNTPVGTRVEIGARLAGYLPDPATAVITLEATGTTQDFQLRPASGSCASLPDAGPCVCIAAEGCDPS
jgi:hypothetical protein